EVGMVQLNVTALMEITKLFLPGMKERKWGRILNVASTAAFQPGPQMAVYYATKAFVLSFSQAIGFELKKSGVRVSCLCPGPTKSGFQKEAHMEKSKLFKGLTMDAETVAATGYRGLLRGKPLIVPGMRNKILIFVVRFAPRRLVLWIVWRAQKEG
ncbi:MAG: short-chain dehydrogenase, partial [Candidatus Peribacteria bacterium]|nr:short-chain dehydrogenase [Candidatus Peribacteria bacterium]